MFAALTHTDTPTPVFIFVFSTLQSLKTLYLQNNRLTYDSFQTRGLRVLRNLEGLDLSDNLFTGVKADMFAGERDFRGFR